MYLCREYRTAALSLESESVDLTGASSISMVPTRLNVRTGMK